MKRKSFIILSIILLITLFSFVYILNPVNNGKNKVINYMHFIVWGNRIKVNTCNELNLNKVDIVFKNELQLKMETNIDEIKRIEFRKDYKPEKITVFQRGKRVNKVPYYYGKQRLEIYYDKKLVGIFFHFQTKHYHVYSYKFNIFLINDSIYTSHEVYGPELERSSFLCYPISIE